MHEGRRLEHRERGAGQSLRHPSQGFALPRPPDNAFDPGNLPVSHENQPAVRGERLADQSALLSHQAASPVNRTSATPWRDTVLATQHAQVCIGERPALRHWLGDPLRQDRERDEIVDQVHLRRDDAPEGELAVRIDDCRHVGLVRDLKNEGLMTLRRRHQPDPGPGHHAQIRLGEQALEIRTDAPLMGMPGVKALSRASGADHLAVREHDFQPAEVAEMIAVRRLAHTTLDRVADHAALRSAVDAVDPQLVAVLGKMGVELFIGHARFDDGVGKFLIDLEDAIHPLEDHNHRAVGAGECRRVTPVAPLAGRPHGYAVARGDPHGGSDLLGRGWKNDYRALGAPGDGAARILV